MRTAGLAILLLLAAPAGAAPAFDLPALMQLLAATPDSQVAFVERKYSSLLAEPLVSRGTLAFRRPDLVEKIVESPRPERFRIEGDELVLTREGRSRRVRLSSEPLVAAFAAGLRGVLAGDGALLAGHYALALEGTRSGWQLDLTPRDPDAARFVQRLVVSGREGRIAILEVREANGDRAVLTVNAP
jgi:outer membrane lipoprotein-sorting protein